MAIDYEYRKPGKKAGRISFIMREVGPLHSTRSAEFFFDYLTESERMELMAAEETRKEALYLQKWPLLIRVLNRVLKVDRRFHVQPKPYDVLRD